MASSPREDNRVPGLVAKSDADNTPVILEADPITKRLKVQATISGSASGTQYTNGDAVASGSAIGGLALGYDGANVRAMKADSQGDGFTIITDGTNAVNTLKSDGTAAGQNSLMTSGANNTIALQSVAVTSGNDLLPATYVGNFAELSIQVTGTWTGTFSYAWSDDNITYQNFNAQILSGGAANTTFATNGMFRVARVANYVRIRCTITGTGTATGVMVGYTIAALPVNVGAAQQGTWTVGSSSATGSAIPANAFYTGISDGTNLRGILGAANALNSTGTGLLTAQAIGQFDDVSPTAITENQFGNLRMSANRNAYQTIRDAAGNERGVNVNASNQLTVISDLTLTGTALKDDTGFGDAVSSGIASVGIRAFNGTSYDRVRSDGSGNLKVTSVGGLMPTGTALNTFSVHLTTNTTTTPIASTAYISSITISNEVAGTTSTVTIQDKQGTPLKLVNGLATTALTTTPTTVNFQTPVKMVSGIDIITAGAVAATVDVWVNYYA